MQTEVTQAQRELIEECLYCGNKELVPHYEGVLDRLAYVPGQWSFHKCVACESLRLAPFPREEDIAGFYPPVYSPNLDSTDQSRLKRLLINLEYLFFYRPQYRAQVRQVLRRTGLKGQDGFRLLDVGCGRGLRLKAFLQHGFDVQGVDIQPEVAEYVRRELGVEASVGDIESLEELFSPKSFDIITAFYLLEHVPNVHDVFTRCLRLLRPGGWCICVVPICDGLQARIFKDRWIHVREAPRHLSLPSRQGLIHAAEAAGFRSVTIGSDSLLNCAGIVGGSLMPGSDLTATYGKGPGRFVALAKRLIGAGLAVSSLPFCAIENYVLGQTSHGMLFAQRASD